VTARVSISSNLLFFSRTTRWGKKIKGQSAGSSARQVQTGEKKKEAAVTKQLKRQMMVQVSSRGKPAESCP